MRTTLFAKVAVASLIVALPVAYFALRPTGAGSIGYTAKQADREYALEAAGLSLAPGWRWPRAPIAAKAPDGGEMMYERGFGTQAADHYWYCSWASRAIDRRQAPSLRRRALTRATSLKKTYYFTRALAPDARSFVRAFLARAEQGHLSGLRRDVKLNCPRSSGD